MTLDEVDDALNATAQALAAVRSGRLRVVDRGETMRRMHARLDALAEQHVRMHGETAGMRAGHCPCHEHAMEPFNPGEHRLADEAAPAA